MTATPEMSPQNTDASDDGLDESSLSAIRSILTEQDAPQPAKTLGRIKPLRVAAPHKQPLPPRKADGLPELAAPVQQAPEEVQGKGAASVSSRRPRFSLFAKLRQSRLAKPRRAAPTPPKDQVASEIGLIDRIKGYRPTKLHLVLAGLALLVVLRPWLVLGLLFLSAVILIGVLLMVGYDGFWQGAMRASRWYAGRRPARAAAIHARLDTFAVRWDAVLDRFPEGTVDGLYLPDFGALADAEARHDAVLERRLANLSGKRA